MLPATLKGYPTQPLSPWLFSAQVKCRMQNLSSRHQGAVLLPNDPEAQMVVKYFAADKPAGYSIGKITCIYNRFLQIGFTAHLVNIEEEAKKFHPGWMAEPLPDQRKKVIGTWNDAAFSPLQLNFEGQYENLNLAKVLPLWHGTSLVKSASICESGFTYFGKHAYFMGKKGTGSTDIGYFGSGIYFTESAHYAALYSQGFLFLSWVAMREPYPVVGDVPLPQKCNDMKLLEGKGAYQNYDAHFIPVASAYPANPNNMIYYPCFNQPPAWHEIVVFQKAQTLPAFIIELEPDLLPSLSEQYTFGALFTACQKGELSQVKKWINEHRTRLNAKNDQGESCYFGAVLGGQLDILQWLYLQNPQGIAQCRKDGWSLMHLAVAADNEKIVLWLTSKDLMMITRGKPSPLDLAAYQEQIPLLKLFLPHKHTLRLEEILKRPCPKTLEFLIDQGLDPNHILTSKQTLLHHASASGQVEHLKLLIDKGAQINAQDLSQKTPIYHAVSQGHLEAILSLLQKGADPTIPAIEGDTVLHVAAFYGYTPILKLLLQYTLLNFQDHDGKQAIHKAVWMHPKPDVVELLLESGADPNAQNTYGYTPLHWAAKHGHTESGKLLVAKGASIEIMNTNGDSPLDLAIRWGQDGFVAHFLDIKPPEELPPQTDIEGFYCTKLFQVRKQEKAKEQIFYFQKLADLYLQKQNWVQAAKLLNGAYAICSDDNLKKYFLVKLESIEGLFLENKGIKLTAYQRGSIANYRNWIRNIRTLYFKEFQEGKPAREILPYLTASYKKMLGSLILNSQEILGTPPCQWACIGMGSMARDEMCPYSDLEFAFLISQKTNQNLSYFIKLSQLLEIRIINFGETHFPVFAPLFKEEAKKSPTPKGLSLDTGGNTPLGKPGFYELIATPQDLAQFQSPKWLKDDIIVTNALSTVCYIAGDKRLMVSYNQAKKEQFEVTDSWMPFNGTPFRSQLAIQLLEGSLKEFKPDLSKQKQVTSAFGIKQELYRPFQSILSSLALVATISSSSTQEIIAQLLNKKIFCPEGAKNLTQAIHNVLNLRLEAHIFYKYEGEFLLHREEKPDHHYLYLDQKKIDLLQEIYRVLIPFHQCAEKFLQSRDLNIFAKASFYDEKLNIQGDNFEKELQYDKAREAYQQMVSLNPHSKVAQTYLGHIEQKMAQYTEALQRHTEALRLAQQEHGESHTNVAGSYSNIGGVYAELGNYVKALEFFQKALQIWLLTPGDPNIAIGYNNIGAVYRSLGNYEKALESLQKALQIYLQDLGERHSEVGGSYNNIGLVYKDLGNYEKALEFLKKALQIRLQVQGDKHPDVAKSYQSIGLVYDALGKHEKALEFYQKDLQISLKILGERHPNVAGSYSNIGVVYDALGDYQKALEFLQKALQIRLQVLGDQHLDLAQSYNSIGVVYSALGNYEKALEFFQKALRILVESYRQMHPHIQTVLEGLIFCARKIPVPQRTGLQETYAFCFKILGSSELLLQKLSQLIKDF